MGNAKQLNGIARNIAHKFAYSAEHFAWLARQQKTPEIVINLVDGKVTPSNFTISRHMNLVSACMENLHLLIEKQYAKPIASALLTVRFQPGEKTMSGSFNLTIVLPDGRTYGATFKKEIIPCR